jgi:matrixin
VALLVLVGTVGAANARSGHVTRVRGGLEKLVFIDYGRLHAPNAQTAATAAATDFRLLSGHPSWPASSAVSYSVSTSGCSNDCGRAATAIANAFNTWDSFSGLTFTQATTGDENPCGGTDSLSWTPIDGPGRTLASTAVCRTLGPNPQIVGFQTVFDSGDTWSDSGDSGKFDIQNTATHEEGHTMGLDHVHAPRDAKLTMYPYINTGETFKSTLGCGDRLGINALYGGVDCVTPPVPND